MRKTAILLAEGFEETEALEVVDLLRRTDIVCDMLSLSGAETVTGSHGITVRADGPFEGADFSAYDGLILPGGRRGTARLKEDERVAELLREFAAAGKLTAAICAAPTVLAAAGLLQGKRAVCYPGMGEQMTGAKLSRDKVMLDGTVLTSRGLGTTIPFALAIVRYFQGKSAVKKLAEAIVYKEDD